MPPFKKFTWLTLGTGILAFGFAAPSRVPIVGDDFQALQEAYSFGRGDLGATIAYGWQAGMEAGHFNPVGQMLGAVYNYAAYGISALLRIDPQIFHNIAAFALLWLSVLTASYALVWAGAFARNPDALPLWQVFALIASITGISIQLHPWSNDPVTTYSMAGLGSVVIAFLLIGLALRALSPGTSNWLGYFWVGIVSVFSVLYYEMLVAAVAATAVIYIGALVPRADRTKMLLRRCLILVGTSVVLPSLVFVGGRILAAPPATSGYTGTSFSLSSAGLRTWVYGMLGTIPMGAWPYSLYKLNPMALGRPAIVVSALLCFGLIILAVFWWKSTPIRLIPSTRLWIPGIALLTLWGLSVAAHAFTLKYISEITAPGLVYLFYVVGLICAAAAAAAAVLMLSWSALLKASVVVLPLLCAFTVMQQAINWTIADVMRAAYSRNAQLAALSTEGPAPEAQRCSALESWATGPWPDYYRASVVKNLDQNYRRVFDQPFCSTYSVSATSG